MATAPQSRPRNRRRMDRDRDGPDGPAFLDDVLAMAGSLASSRKHYTASQIETLAESVREFSDSMPDVPALRAYATTAADSLEDLASYVEDSEFADMVHDARDFARRHPLVTLGGSIAAGLVITQLVQSRAANLRNRASERRKSQARPTGTGRRSRKSRGSAIESSPVEIPVSIE